MITTIEEFRSYLAEMSARADTVNRGGWEPMCAQMWKQFLPHAIHFWTVAGVLNQIADTIDPPKEDNDEGDTNDE
jgi:hypothetical protein